MDRDKNIEKLLRNYRVPSTKSKEDAWEDLSRRWQPGKEKTFKIGRLLQVAAVLAVTIVFTFLSDSLVFVQNYSTGFGEQQSVTLKDNSKVILNTNSRLKVNYSFITGKRKLFLKGHALFDIKTGKEFSVKFHGGKVTVLGTRFAIQAYNYIAPEISCLSGKVEVKTVNDRKFLVQGEGAVLKNVSEIKKTEIREENILAEMNGRYFWKNESLDQIFKILEAQFGYDIKAPHEIKNRKFTGAINLKNLEHSLNILALAMDLDYSIVQKNKEATFENKK